jgi:GTP-binding protein EngB required for normal cell division
MESNEIQIELTKFKQQFKLLNNVIKPNNDTVLKVDLSNIEKIINEKLPNTLEKNAPANFPELYFDFKYEYSKFREFILYEHLIGKKIVALGGGFSSGKSSFLNSLMGKKILPQDINPSTSVPAYIVNGNDISVYGVNVFDSKIEMEIENVKSISHGFGEIRNEEDELTSEEVTLGHILNSIFLSTPLQPYENVAFLDTPGYSKADTESYSSKTDEKIARAQLNSSDYILWFIQSDAGTITEEDINFINTLKKEIPKLIIVNKADKRTKSDIEDIVTKIKGVLDIKGIQYVDVLAYSSRKSNEFDSEKLKISIESLNNKISEATFAYNFKVLFSKCKEYYEYSIDSENKRLNRLNTALTLSDNDTVSECISSLVKEIKRNLSEIKDMKTKLKEIQDEFFGEIKTVSDIVGIEMPEPSEIDLIKDKIVDPLKVIQEYKQKHGIKSNPNLSIMIQEILGDIKPVINKVAGGLEYKDVLTDIIQENLVVDKDKIRFNEIYNNANEFAKIISETL